MVDADACSDRAETTAISRARLYLRITGVLTANYGTHGAQYRPTFTAAADDDDQKRCRSEELA